MPLTTAPRSMAHEEHTLGARTFSLRLVWGWNGIRKASPPPRRARRTGSGRVIGVSPERDIYSRRKANKWRGRQTYGNSKTAIAGRGSGVLLAREIMERSRRCCSSDRYVCGVPEAQSLHVGCFSRLMRAGYVFTNFGMYLLRPSRSRHACEQYLQDDVGNEKRLG